MDRLLPLFGTLIAVGCVYVVVPVAVGAYRWFRGSKTVICPEISLPAEIELDAARAATGAVFGQRDLRVVRCSRQDERHYCNADCVAQVT